MNKLAGFGIGLVLSVMIGCTSFAEGIDYSLPETVQKVQESLNEAGFDCGTPDGVAGEQTKNAITQYKVARGIGSGDAIDEDLLVSLGLLSLPLNEETAMEATVVAFTNRFATDVFTEDGNDYDSSKFHSFEDNYLEITAPGTWADMGEGVWHGEHLKMKVRDFGSELDISADVKTDKGNYVVFNISGSAPSYPDASVIEKESDFEKFFVVPSSLVENSDDDAEATNDEKNSGGSSDAVTPELKEITPH